MHKTLLLNVGKALATPGKVSEKVEEVYTTVKDANLDRVEQAALFITLFEIIYNIVKQMEGHDNGSNHIRPKFIV